jgi:hypothetical protein
MRRVAERALQHDDQAVRRLAKQLFAELQKSDVASTPIDQRRDAGAASPHWPEFGRLTAPC